MNAPSAPLSVPAAGMASLVYVPAVTAAEEHAARELVSSALDAFRGPVSAEGETSAEGEHTPASAAEEHTPAADASPSLARAVSVLLLALDALDTARADFNANDAAGRAAEGETDAAERAWSVDQIDENWSRVEDAQRRARQAFLRGRVLLAGLARVEGEFRSALNQAFAAERAALYAEFKAGVAPLLADYAAHAIEMQEAGRKVDAMRDALRERMMRAYHRQFGAGAAAVARGMPAEMDTRLDGYTLANCAVRAVRGILTRRGVRVGDHTPLNMLIMCDSAQHGLEGDTVEEAAALLAATLDDVTEARREAGEVAPPARLVRVRNVHTAKVEKIAPGAEGTLREGSALAALLRGGLVVVVPSAEGGESAEGGDGAPSARAGEPGAPSAPPAYSFNPGAARASFGDSINPH